MPAGLSPRQHRGVHRLNDKKLHAFDFLFNDLTCARSCTSRSDSDNQRVESAADDMEDLASGRLPMDLRIRRISELLRHKVVGMFSKDFFGLVDRALHEIQPMSQNDARAISPQEGNSFDVDVIGHS